MNQKNSTFMAKGCFMETMEVTAGLTNLSLFALELMLEWEQTASIHGQMLLS